MAPLQHVNFQVWQTFNFYKILLNSLNQSSVPKNSSGNVKKKLYSNMKIPLFKIFAYKHFFVKTLDQPK